MKLLIFTLFTLITRSAFAVDNYNNNGAIFPDEQSANGLPYAIPCTNNDHGNSNFIVCTWLEWPRDIIAYDPTQSRNIIYSNHLKGRCIKGRCLLNDGSAKLGNWDRDTAFTVSLWYYIGESSDGKPVAYRNDGGPYVNKGKAVSYVEAGQLLWQFYQGAGVSEKLFNNTFEQRYDGGVKRFQQDQAKISEKTSETNPVKVTEASCNPQMDDDCHVNGKKVPKVALGQYLPTVKVDDVESAGGYCEYPVCYDSSDKPIGIR
ncbi:hypothetical protein QN399_15205 [Pseudomonas sp. 10C3]|uniref:hypothetical protein n=1 Tax=Pseudomonas sp. 10C3 TaxID=3118753 RepID=UPI002E8106DE|nr:hypothetical protein [Pseudomonas sp. 10C3]MEE3507594.1 hypothetical protein [Pseudomonas sp. 10C3]